MKLGVIVLSGAAVASAIVSETVYAEISSGVQVLSVRNANTISLGGDAASSAAQSVVYTSSDGTTYTQQDLDNLAADVSDAQGAKGSTGSRADTSASTKTTKGCKISQSDAKALASDDTKLAESFKTTTGENLSDMTTPCKAAFKAAVEACAQDDASKVSSAQDAISSACIEEKDPPQVDTPNPVETDGTTTSTDNAATTDTSTAATTNTATTAATNAATSSGSLKSLLQQAALQALLEKLFGSSSSSSDDDDDSSSDDDDDEDSSDAKTCDSVDDDSESARAVSTVVNSDGGSTVTTRIERICDNGNTQVETTTVETDVDGNVESTTVVTTVE